jgi:hypothetical protein
LCPNSRSHSEDRVSGSDDGLPLFQPANLAMCPAVIQIF